MSANTLPSVVLAVAMALLTGCAHHRTRAKEVFAAPPRVTWQDLSAASFTPPMDGYMILGPAGSVGRFPAAVGVTRVAIEEGRPDREPTLPGKPKNEFLTWNRAFDELMAISSVFPVAQRDLGGGEATPEQIVAAFRGLHAGLGLIYATNPLSERETEMIGVLYETKTSRPLAAIAARAVSTLPADPKERDDLDPWKHDSKALVRARFVEHCFVCLRELIQADQPERIDVPPGWIPAGPVRPVQWPTPDMSFRP